MVHIPMNLNLSSLSIKKKIQTLKDSNVSNHCLFEHIRYQQVEYKTQKSMRDSVSTKIERRFALISLSLDSLLATLAKSA
jgi:hypothetical protein